MKVKEIHAVGAKSIAEIRRPRVALKQITSLVTCGNCFAVPKTFRKDKDYSPGGRGRRSPR